jgi:CRP-like cAMP-binding protein
VPLFRDLPDDELEFLNEYFKPHAFPAGTVLFAQGDLADRVYVLLQGKVSIRYKPHDGDFLEVTSIQSGGVFGWSAALGRQQYTSYAVVSTDCVVLEVRGDALRRLCRTHPKIGVVILERMAEVIASRLENTHQMVVDMLWKGVDPGKGRE